MPPPPITALITPLDEMWLHIPRKNQFSVHVSMKKEQELNKPLALMPTKFKV